MSDNRTRSEVSQGTVYSKNAAGTTSDQSLWRPFSTGWNLIGTVFLSNCRNTADKLLTYELFSATLTVLIRCIVIYLFPVVAVKAYRE
jgi:hypothetical protein